jgi:predicted Zn-dependent peptidase
MLFNNMPHFSFKSLNLQFAQLTTPSKQKKTSHQVNIPLSRLETYVQRVNAITPTDIPRLASEYLVLTCINTENMTMIVVGDVDSVMP